MDEQAFQAKEFSPTNKKMPTNESTKESVPIKECSQAIGSICALFKGSQARRYIDNCFSVELLSIA